LLVGYSVQVSRFGLALTPSSAMGSIQLSMNADRDFVCHLFEGGAPTRNATTTRLFGQDHSIAALRLFLAALAVQDGSRRQ
jgi:hypothetical protein